MLLTMAEATISAARTIGSVEFGLIGKPLESLAADLAASGTELRDSQYRGSVRRGRYSPRDRRHSQRGLGSICQGRSSRCGAASGYVAEQIISTVPFRYLSDALTHDEALEILRRHEATKVIES